jgi:hypothetical protein
VAITENRGGYQPNAPQNNPNNIGAGGGNTQSGKASGFAYGMNKAINEQSSQGNAAVAAMTPASRGTAPTLPQVTPITAPTEFPDQPVTDGAALGPGMNTIPGLPQSPIADNTQFNQNIEAYRPVLTYIANQPSTSTDTRKVISLLLTMTPNENMA